jgi:O-antigen/teichoic acid export membrane protein
MKKTNSQKIAYNTIVQITGKVVTTILSIVLIAYLTRYLGVFGYGQYSTAFIYLSFFGVIADFGFFSILVREISAKPENEEKIASNLLTLRSLFALSVYLISIGIAYFIPYAHIIKIGIVLIALANFFLTLNSSLVGIFQARHKMDRSVITDIVGRMIILGITIYLISNNFGLTTIFLAVVIGNFINLLLSWLFILPIIKLKPAFNLILWKKIFISAWPLGIAAMFSIIYFRIDSVMLSLYRGSTDVGIYAAPYKILEVLFFIPGIFMGNVFPIFTKYIKENNPKLKDAVQKSFDFLVISGMGILFGGMALSGKIIRIVAGQDFVTASTMNFHGIEITAPILFQILLFAMAVSYIAYLFNPIIIAENHQSALIKPAIFATLLNIGLNIIFIPIYGYLAAAVITVITEVFILIYQGSIVYKLLPYMPKITIFAKSLVAGLIMGLVLYTLNNLNVFILILIGVLIYFLLLLLLRAVNVGIIKSLFKSEAK